MTVRSELLVMAVGSANSRFSWRMLSHVRRSLRDLKLESSEVIREANSGMRELDVVIEKLGSSAGAFSSMSTLL